MGNEVQTAMAQQDVEMGGVEERRAPAEVPAGPNALDPGKPSLPSISTPHIRSQTLLAML